MNHEVNVFLLGLLPVEKATLESFFKLPGSTGTLYKIVPDVAQAIVVVVNSDSPTAVKWATDSISLPQKALFIGASDPSKKWPAAPKPIEFATVLGLLDLLTMAYKNAPAQPAPARRDAAFMAAPVPVSPNSAVSSKRTRGSSTVRQGSGTKGSSGFVESSFIGIGQAPRPLSSAQQYDNILVVDDSDTALKFMQNRLARYGFRTDLAKNGEEALVRVATQPYKFVFLEVTMQGLDGYQICRAIKQDKYTSGKAPIVVMLTSRGGSANKIRGGLAGCDAFLTKPLDEDELLKVLSKYDEQVKLSFSDTKLRSRGVSTMHPEK